MKDRSPPVDVLPELPGLRRYALSLTRNPSDAEDLVHDALVRALERSDQFKPGRSLRAWLLSILHNRHVDGVRAKRTERVRNASLNLVAPQSAPPDQEQPLILHDTRRAFDALPEEQRSALHLVAVEGLPYEEAAAALAIPVGTLVSRVSRARASLRAADRSECATNVVELRAVGGPHVPNA